MLAELFFLMKEAFVLETMRLWSCSEPAQKSGFWSTENFFPLQIVFLNTHKAVVASQGHGGGSSLYWRALVYIECKHNMRWLWSCPVFTRTSNILSNDFEKEGEGAGFAASPSWHVGSIETKSIYYWAMLADLDSTPSAANLHLTPIPNFTPLMIR